MSKLNRPIKVVSIIVLITIVVKILGFLRIFFMAKIFGTGMEASAFEAAYRIPDLLFTSIGVALSTTFIPIFTEYLNKEGKKEAIFFANNVANTLLVVTALLSIVGVFFAPFIVKAIYWGYQGPIYYLTVDLVRIMFPIIIFIALSFTYVGVLQSFGEFNIPASLSLPANIINIAYLIFLSSYFGIYGFAVAVLLGWSTQLFIQIPALEKQGYSYKAVISLKSSGLRKMLIMVVPIILGTSVQQINSLINSALASGLGESAVSALGYASYLYIIIVGVFTYALSAVVFPSLSKMHVVQDYDEFRKTINQAIKAIIFVMLPIMAGILVLRVPIIQALLQRGKFNFDSTILTSTVLFYYSIGMISFGIQEILNRAFYALHNTKTPMIISAIGMALNIGLSFLFVKSLSIGGLALAASIASIFIATALTLTLYKHIPKLIEKSTLITLAKSGFSAIFMAGIVYFVYNTFKLAPDSSFIKVAVVLAGTILCGAVAYALPNLILKTDEAFVIINIVKNKFVRKVKEGEA